MPVPAGHTPEESGRGRPFNLPYLPFGPQTRLRSGYMGYVGYVASGPTWVQGSGRRSEPVLERSSPLGPVCLTYDVTGVLP